MAKGGGGSLAHLHLGNFPSSLAENPYENVDALHTVRITLMTWISKKTVQKVTQTEATTRHSHNQISHTDLPRGIKTSKSQNECILCIHVFICLPCQVNVRGVGVIRRSSLHR
jgi:hypothetical protein